MSDAKEISSASSPSLSLADPVIQVLQDILEVNLRGCSIALGTWISGDDASFSFTSAASGKIPENQKRLDVIATFTLHVLRPNHSEPILRIEATYQIAYLLKKTEGISAQNIEAFAVNNGLYNIWPYWREFVQSMTLRMGLPPITVPVYRISPKKETPQKEPESSVDVQVASSPAAPAL